MMIGKCWMADTEICEFKRDDFFRCRGMKRSCGLEKVAALEGKKKNG